MKPNAITRRLGKLSDQWGRFSANSAARALCWQFTAQELPMFDAFIDVESDEAHAEHSAVFIHLNTPFAAETYGQALCRSLADGMLDGREALVELDLASDWFVPARGQHEPDLQYLIRTCESFHDHYALQGQLVLMLRPEELPDPASFHGWLLQLAAAAPERVRALVLDSVEHPIHAALSTLDPARIVVMRAALDMPSALAELSSDAGYLDTPGGKFRDLFVRMSNALAQNDLPAAATAGESAIAVARGAELWHLSVPVHLALGAALLGQSRGPEAIERFRDAEADAERGSAHTDPAFASACRSLLLQSRISHGSALVVLEDFVTAATHFETTSQLAAAAEQWLVAFDAQRLASYGFERAQLFERGWYAGLHAIEIARKLEPSERATSTLPYLGEGMLRIAQASTFRPDVKAIERALHELLDPADSVPPPSAAGDATANP